MASFPTSTVTKPAGIAVSNNVVVGHVDFAWDEIIAVEGVLRGSSTLAGAGVNLNLKSGATGATPLALQGFADQTADILTVGTSASSNDLLRVTAAGKLHLPGTVNTTGVMLGTSTVTNIWSTGTNVLARPGADATGAVKVRNTDDTSTAVSVDTTNLRVGIGDDTAPAAALHLSAATAVTTAAFGIRFGNDATNLYRSAATILKTDGSLDIAGNVLLNGDFSVSRTAANIATIATGDTLRAGASANFELSGEAGTNSLFKVTKTATGNLTDAWMQTTIIGAETSSRFKTDAAGKSTWTDGTNPATPVTLGINGANVGLITNKDLTVTGITNVTTLSLGAAKIKQGATDNTYSGSDVTTLYTKDLVLHSTVASATRLGLKRPDGTIRYLRLDNDDQIIIEAS